MFIVCLLALGENADWWRFSINVEYKKYLRCRVRTRGTYGTNRRYFCVEFLQESATTTQKRAANIYVSADDYTDPLSRQISESEIYPTMQESCRSPSSSLKSSLLRQQFVRFATTVSGFDGVLSGNCDDTLTSKEAWRTRKRLRGHSRKGLHVLSQRPCGKTCNIDWCVLQRQFCVVTSCFENRASSFI